jgi:hypothetical protein
VAHRTGTDHHATTTGPRCQSRGRWRGGLRVGVVGAGLAVLSLLGHAAEWRVVGAESFGGIDMVAGDDPLLAVQLDGDAGVEAWDVRLLPLDVHTGALAKVLSDCDRPWQPAVSATGLLPGEQVTFFLPPALPVGAWTLAVRPSGSNAAWEARGEPLWIVFEPLVRAVPCPSPTALSLDRAPLLAAARARAREATVRLLAGEARGLGVVINPYGWVLTDAELVGAAGDAPVRVAFEAGALRAQGGERLVDYVPIERAAAAAGVSLPPTPPGLAVLVPERGQGLPPWVVAHAPVVDAAMTPDGPRLRFSAPGWLEAVRHGDPVPVPAVPETPPGAPIVGPDAVAALAFRAPLRPEDRGGPVFDAEGRVWAVARDGREATWAVAAARWLLSEDAAPALRALRQAADR